LLDQKRDHVESCFARSLRERDHLVAFLILFLRILFGAAESESFSLCLHCEFSRRAVSVDLHLLSSMLSALDAGTDGSVSCNPRSFFET